ncbi:hypothetical protein AAGG49_21990, partial [Stenotrophomonas maltophilia]|uniref:hypothetical protein n=1 Tax=Stenotrophomonas maltophilia TaxID=40324 RepID=UPI00313E7A15
MFALLFVGFILGWRRAGALLFVLGGFGVLKRVFSAHLGGVWGAGVGLLVGRRGKENYGNTRLLRGDHPIIL